MLAEVEKASCSYCGISTRESHRAVFIRLLPDRDYLIICDGCLGRERRHLLTEVSELQQEPFLIPVRDDLVRLLTARVLRAALAQTRRWIQSFYFSRGYNWPVFLFFHRARKRSL
jgi:hypothetical protein